MKVKGYEVVNKTNDTARGGTWNDAAGAWINGGNDLILMRIPMFVWEERQSTKRNRMDMLRGIKQELDRDAEKASRELTNRSGRRHEIRPTVTDEE